MEWESPWGKGFPGWHLECSAMSMKYLGETFDIHTGGVDHIPIHHTNEILQSEGATGKKFVNYWVHGGWLSLGDSEKMSKSKGSTVLLDDLIERGYDPLAFRYLVLTAHYRSPLQFSWEALDGAATALSRIRAAVAQFIGEDGDASQKYLKRFSDALSSDLNSPEAIATVWGLLKDSNVTAGSKSATLRRMDRVLGLRLHAKPEQGNVEVPAEVLNLVYERNRLRRVRQFTEADEVRQRIVDAGFEVMDTPDGTALRSQRE